MDCGVIPHLIFLVVGCLAGTPMERDFLTHYRMLKGSGEIYAKFSERKQLAGSRISKQGPEIRSGLMEQSASLFCYNYHMNKDEDLKQIKDEILALKRGELARLRKEGGYLPVIGE